MLCHKEHNFAFLLIYFTPIESRESLTTGTKNDFTTQQKFRIISYQSFKLQMSLCACKALEIQ